MCWAQEKRFGKTAIKHESLNDHSFLTLMCPSSVVYCIVYCIGGESFTLLTRVFESFGHFYFRVLLISVRTTACVIYIYIYVCVGVSL